MSAGEGKSGGFAEPVPTVDIPESVRLARERAESEGFRLASDDRVGRLLSVLAASVPEGGQILELGTGVGVGLAWIAHGLGTRRDVTVRSVECDPGLARIARSLPWPATVSVIGG